MTFIRFNYAPRRIEELSEDKTFPDHELASLVCSKVYYHLGAFDVALRFALGAGKLFDVNQVWSLLNFNLHISTNLSKHLFPTFGQKLVKGIFGILGTSPI